MAVQFLPIIKAVAPYLAQVATAAIPAFTSKPEAVKSDTVVAKQIEELQAAVTQNAQSIHVLAEKIQQAMQGIENAAQEAKQQVAAYKTLLFASFGLSAVSLAVCIYLLVR
jgi:methyl-accepting chemotaxis protein